MINNVKYNYAIEVILLSSVGKYSGMQKIASTFTYRRNKQYVTIESEHMYVFSRKSAQLNYHILTAISKALAWNKRFP